MNKRIAQKMLLASAMASLAFAQVPEEPARPFRGVLMDANCPAIQSRNGSPSGSAQATEATRSRTAAPSGAAATATQPQNTTVSNSTAVANSTNVGGAAAETASGAGASGSLSTTTNSGGTAGSRNGQYTMTGIDNSQAGHPTPQAAATPPTDARSTAIASSPGASGASSVTVYGGGTGRAEGVNKDVNAGRTVNPGTGSSAQGSAATGAAEAIGERNRAGDPLGAGSQWATVQDKYASCHISMNTSTFALMSNDRVYLIDDTSGAVRQRMAALPSSSDWQAVTLMGVLNGDRLSVSSVQ